jgi:GH43 family beta-xylosidase
MATYTNPVWDEYFADPFVLRHDGRYFAYGSAPEAHRTVPALESTDLVHWEPLGHVLEPLPGEPRAYWAPEVAFRDGRFHMYYSAGGAEGEGHRLRLAIADDPRGRFVDEGVVRGADDAFTIDAHPFRDDDGSWYLFHCRDFLDGERPGTGIVVDRLADPQTLAGDRRTVVRPFADWNLFMRERDWYGQTWDAWYTVEGPFVRKRGGRYYCFFSGGAWREPNYGVGYAVAEHPLGPWEVAVGDGPLVLATAPDAALGPGHASIVSGPDGTTEWIVYHAWDPGGEARTMRIDELVWRPEGPRCDGPSTAPRRAPG